jgi:hypothetical protein
MEPSRTRPPRCDYRLHRVRVLSFPDRKKAVHETAVQFAVPEATGFCNDEAASPVVDIESCAARLASESRTAINAHP